MNARIPILSWLAVLTIAWTAPASGQGVRLFEQARFRGSSRNFSSTIPVMNPRRVGSVSVGRGSWQLCSGLKFTGRCVTVNRNVPDLSSYGIRRVASLRPRGDNTPGVAGWYAVLFDQPTFRGHPINIERAASDIRSSVRSITIGAGVWELCDGPNFTGHCTVLTRSASDLRPHGLDGRVRSARPLTRQPR